MEIIRTIGEWAVPWVETLGQILLLYLLLRRLIRTETNGLRAEVKRVETSTKVRIKRLEESTKARIKSLEESTKARIKSLESVVKENRKDTRAILNAIFSWKQSSDARKAEAKRDARVAANRSSADRTRGKPVRSAESD